MVQLKFILLALLLVSAGQDKSKPVKWALSKSCSLTVNGSTNINKFSCIIPEYIKPDTLVLYTNRGTETVKITGQMVLDINAFDCHNGMMTKDLRKTLKAKEYPRLTVTFISLSKYPDPARGECAISGLVNISIAGVSKRFEVAYRCIPEGLKNITIVGTKIVNFSDFNITPPTKLGGMIKTNNSLEVEFTLKAGIFNE